MESHPRVTVDYRIPKVANLPVRLRRRACNCGHYKGVPVEEFRPGPPICGNCRKVVPWFFFKCVKCDKHFIKDFRHPKFCSLYPTCWEHTLEMEWEYCEQHVPIKYEFYQVIVEPIGLNPLPLAV